ncbi:hypothetical protein J6590_013700 [Homalodisca vitripennis]|nr:hypothetical protein J6590_013700 [Homalodisca vitripennis]
MVLCRVASCRYTGSKSIAVYLNSIVDCLDIIVLTECWLRAGEGKVNIVGSDLVSTDKTRNQNDGVVILVNKRLPVTTTQTTLGDVYGISLDFTHSIKHFNILAFYSSFDINVNNCIDPVDNYYNNMERRQRYIFLGDDNIDLFTCNDDITSIYLNCLNGYGPVQCVDKPTRVTEHSITCIDHIFVSYDEMNHYSTELNTTLNTAVSRSIDTSLAPITYIDQTLITNILSNSHWELVIDIDGRLGTSIAELRNHYVYRMTITRGGGDF